MQIMDYYVSTRTFKCLSYTTEQYEFIKIDKLIHKKPIFE